MEYKKEFEEIRNKLNKLEQHNFMRNKENESKRKASLEEARTELDNFIFRGEQLYKNEVKTYGDSQKLDDLYITIQLAKGLK